MDNKEYNNEISYIIIDSLADLNINYILKNCSGLKDINISFNLFIYDEDVIRKMYALIMEAKGHGFNISVDVNAEGKQFSAKNLMAFFRLNKQLETENVKFGFDGGIKNDYEVRDVVAAQSKLRKLINDIKRSQLSPYEKYLYIYDFLTKKIYKDSEEDPSKSRDIIALMNGDYIVCTGYAKLMEYLCKEIGIECQTQHCSIKNKKGEEYKHENNLVRIDDDKYNIHGWYYSDACWDHATIAAPNKRTFAFCLIPMKDKDNFNLDVTINDDSLFYYDNPENFYKLVDGEYYGDTFGFDFSKDKYSKAIRHYGLEERYRISEDKVQDMLTNNYIKDQALKKLTNILKKKEIPSDVYLLKTEVPYGCSLEFLLAMTIIGEEDIVNKKVDELKRHYESDEILDFTDSARSYSNDVYAELENMGNAENNDDLKWQGVQQRLVKINMARMVQNMIKSNPCNKMGEPIPMSSFKKALKKIYSEAVLMTEQKYQSTMESTINNTLKLTQTAYKEEALNCFAQENKIQKENGAGVRYL